jgi:hypothetical protein
MAGILTKELTIGGCSIKPIGVARITKEVLIELTRGHESSTLSVAEGSEIVLGKRSSIRLSSVRRDRIKIEVDMK